jgi:MFS family permease
VTESPSGEEPEPDGRLEPTGFGAVGASVMVGLVLGWLLHPISDRFGNPPVISWLQPLALLFVAALLASAAYGTHRTLHVRPERMEPHRAVNRLVLARACMVVGGLVAGGYFGYAVSWLGDPAELADERIVRSTVAGLAGVGIATAALFLERACRVRSDDPEA